MTRVWRGDERLMLVFTPAACAGDPLAALAAALPEVDAVQVRVKSAEHPSGASPAAELLAWCERALELAAGRVPVLVNDRVDVAAALAADGLAGVHLGDRDLPPAEARRLLGPDAVLGLSTHTGGDVAAAASEPVDYLGFGPVHPTRTKGYERGLGAEAAWLASEGATVPLFPIGGIDATNAGELARVGRAAVGAGILAAPDPGAAARTIRGVLAGGD